MSKQLFILPLNKVGINDVETVGGKNASLGEMIQHLSSLGINIPNGFVITVFAYHEFIRFNNLYASIKEAIGAIDFESIESLRRGGLQVRQCR